MRAAKAVSTRFVNLAPAGPSMSANWPNTSRSSLLWEAANTLPRALAMRFPPPRPWCAEYVTSPALPTVAVAREHLGQWVRAVDHRNRRPSGTARQLLLTLVRSETGLAATAMGACPRPLEVETKRGSPCAFRNHALVSGSCR